MEIRVTGADEIGRVAAAVRKVGTDRQIVNDMAREIKRGARPIIGSIKDRAVAILPGGGGLGAWVARSRITTLVRRGSTSAGVLIRGRRRGRADRNPITDLHSIDLGKVRHPSWGEAPWHAQAVAPGFFTDAVTEEGRDMLEAAVLTAADNASRRIVNG